MTNFNLRHWLIRKLACGDMILLNFNRDETGSLRPRNLGPTLIANCAIRSWSPFATSARFGPGIVPPNTGLALWTYGQPDMLDDVSIIGPGGRA